MIVVANENSHRAEAVLVNGVVNENSDRAL